MPSNDTSHAERGRQVFAGTPRVPGRHHRQSPSRLAQWRRPCGPWV